MTRRLSARAGERVAVAMCTLLLAFSAAAPACAATRDYHFRPLGSERGLSQNSVTAFAEDADGFVWVGTQGGLHRYDGQRYQLFRHDPRDKASLPDSYVTAIAVDGREALWVGTYSEFLARLDLRTGAIKRFAVDGGAALPGSPRKQVLAVLPVDGQVWVGTAAGLLRFDPRTGRSVSLLAIDPRAVSPSPNQALVRDRD